MTPADLKIRREALGLSQGSLAHRLGVTDRTIRSWESGKFPIPEGVDDDLLELEAWTDDLVMASLHAARELIEQLTHVIVGPPESVTLTAYATDESLWAAHPGFEPLPASWHRMLLWRVSEQLDIDEVHFVY